METIQSLLLASVCCPNLTGVEDCTQDAGSVHRHPTLLWSVDMTAEAFAIMELISI